MYCVVQNQYKVDGDLMRSWDGHQINDLALTADCKYLLATPASGQVVRVHQLQGNVECQIAAPSAIISMSLASDFRHLLVRLLPTSQYSPGGAQCST